MPMHWAEKERPQAFGRGLVFRPGVEGHPVGASRLANVDGLGVVECGRAQRCCCLQCASTARTGTAITPLSAMPTSGVTGTTKEQRRHGWLPIAIHDVQAAFSQLCLSSTR